MHSEYRKLLTWRSTDKIKNIYTFAPPSVYAADPLLLRMEKTWEPNVDGTLLYILHLIVFLNSALILEN